MEDKVEEVPGLYGGVRVEEKVIQRIWSQSAFITHNLVSEEGKKLSILNAGTWNRSEEGPDFRNAVIWIGGEKKFGDVEIHFHERDWKNHGHDRDRNYNQVILHVCLFPRSSSASRIVNSREKKSRNYLCSLSFTKDWRSIMRSGPSLPSAVEIKICRL
jgi:hypothetical protein